MSSSASYAKPIGDGTTIRELMRTGTKDLHDVADDLFENTLLKKKMSTDIYRVYVSGLYYLYSAMEELMEENVDHDLVAPVYFPDELNRKHALEQDLEYFYGEDWRNEIYCIESIQEYIHHLKTVVREEPARLIPHIYVRYFGDMSGGQIIRKIILRLYGLPLDGTGTAFYDFTHIANIKDFKTLFSSRLTTLSLDEDMKNMLVNEARTVFELNINMLREIVQMAETADNGYMKTENGKDIYLNGKDNVKSSFMRSSIMALVSVAITALLPWVHEQVVHSLP